MAKKKTKKREHATTAPANAATAGVPSSAAVATTATVRTPLDAAGIRAAAEMQTQEMEVLAAIFDQDLVLKSSTPLYAHIFTILVRCEAQAAAPGGLGMDPCGAGVSPPTAEVHLHFDLGRGYPLTQPPNLAVEKRHGLSDEDAASLTSELQRLAADKVGDVMIYDLVMHATEFVQDHIQDQSSFFDQMMQRQQDRETEKRREEAQLLQLEEEEARARSEEILAMIDAERRKKRETIKQQRLERQGSHGDPTGQQRRRRRRRHRSSIDLQGDGDDDGGGSSYVTGDDGSSRLSGDYSGDDNDELRSDVTSQLGAQRSGIEDASSSSDSSDLETLGSEHVLSRYHSDFKELGLLGRGGGGEVVKARNRLDRQLYAVKKVKLDPEDPTMKKKILREVKTISRMQHRHIVRYFQAWIEGDDGGDDGSSEDDSEFGGCSEDEDDDDDDGLDLEGPDSEDEDEDDDDDWLGTMSNSVHFWSKSQPKRGKGGHGRRVSSRVYSSSSSGFVGSSTPGDDGFDWESLDTLPPEDFASSGGGRHHGGGGGSGGIGGRLGAPRRKRSEKLYIQMEFCEGKALREVIDKGALWQDPDKIWTLFRQILEAIVYIHRQGIIHRDIKPPNIFLDAEGTVKLGDFGLAIRPQKIEEEDSDDAGDGVDGGPSGTEPSTGTGGGKASSFSATGALLAQSSGSSAAELYERLKMEDLQSTRMRGAPINVPRDLTSVTTASYDPGDNITAGVGTAFYRAPEQEREGQRYDQKADLFSLGILFFEMWSPPFTTLMERAQALTALRENHELSPDFAAPESVRQIILWLCQQSPASRPTAAELLASHLLPAKMEVEGTYLREALQTLANPQGKFFGQLIDALLTQEPGSHVDYTYDHLEAVKMRTYVQELRMRTYVKATLRKIFERHGALEHTTPLLMPRSTHHNATGAAVAAPQNACSLVDGGGVAVTLPFDLTERLARFVARHNIPRLKCYQFDRVYRRSAAAGGHPREFLEADFDIVWDDRASLRFVELEGLQVVSEVIHALATSLGSYYLRLNDARITRGILELGGVPVAGRRELLKLLSNEVSAHVHAGVPSRQPPTFKPGRWKFVGRKMKEHGISQEALDACRPFFVLPADGLACLDTIETELQKLYAKRVSQLKAAASSGTEAKVSKQRQKLELQLKRLIKDANEGIVGLRQILQATDSLRLTGPVCTRVDIGLSPRPERFAAGFVFQAVLVTPSPSTTSQASIMATGAHGNANSLVIAEGGRYDQLIARFKLPAAYMKASNVAAVGVRFSVDKMVSCVMASLQASAAGELKCPPAAQEHLAGGRTVLVCSAGRAADTVLLRMQIALVLWGAGIGADFLHPDPLHLEDLEDYCTQQRIPFMIIVQTHMMREKKQVKVRAVRNQSESDAVVNCSALVEYIQERLATGGAANTDTSVYHAYDAMGASAGGSARDHTAPAVSLQPLFDVQVVDGKHYTKETRGFKFMDNQKIVRRVSKWITSSFSARGEDAMRVLSVDLPFGLMRELSSSLMEHGTEGIERASAAFPRYRKQIRYTADEILALEPTTGGRERYILLHSMVDDRYDLMSLASKGSRKSDKESRHVSRRTP